MLLWVVFLVYGLNKREAKIASSVHTARPSPTVTLKPGPTATVAAKASPTPKPSAKAAVSSSNTSKTPLTKVTSREDLARLLVEDFDNATAAQKVSDASSSKTSKLKIALAAPLKLFSKYFSPIRADEFNIGELDKLSLLEYNGTPNITCPGANYWDSKNPFPTKPYVPLNWDFTFGLPYNWCIRLGESAATSGPNTSLEWYVFTKRKVGLNPQNTPNPNVDDVAQIEPNSDELLGPNDLYFCPPSICKMNYYDYRSSIDASPYALLPTRDPAGTTEPTSAYNFRVHVRTKVGGIQNMYSWVGSGRSIGAGFCVNFKETNRAFLDEAQKFGVYDNMRCDAKTPKEELRGVEKGWRPKKGNLPDATVDPSHAVVFDLYVPCPEGAQGDEESKKLQEKYDKLMKSDTEVKKLVERYYGGCLTAFQPNRSYYDLKGWRWEKTGAKAYWYWMPGRNNKNPQYEIDMDRVYDIRTDSPKLVRVECYVPGAVYEGNGSCRENQIKILGNYQPEEIKCKDSTIKNINNCPVEKIIYIDNAGKGEIDNSKLLKLIVEGDDPLRGTGKEFSAKMYEDLGKQCFGDKLAKPNADEEDPEKTFTDNIDAIDRANYALVGILKRSGIYPEAYLDVLKDCMTIRWWNKSENRVRYSIDTFAVGTKNTMVPIKTQVNTQTKPDQKPLPQFENF